jgi:hypothetical protein
MADIQCCTLNTANLPGSQPSLQPTQLVPGQVGMLNVIHLTVAPSWTHDTCVQYTVTQSNVSAVEMPASHQRASASIPGDLMCDSWSTSGTWTDLTYVYFKFLLLVTSTSLLHAHTSVRSASVLTWQHIITSSVFNSNPDCGWSLGKELYCNCEGDSQPVKS